MNIAQERNYSRESREWIPLTLHRTGWYSDPNLINISNGYITGLQGFPQLFIKHMRGTTEIYRGKGAYTPQESYQDGDEIYVRAANLAEVRTFYVRYNQVKQLQFNLGDLTSVKAIGLRNNGISGLGHVDLSNCHELENLDLSGNSSVTDLTVSSQAPIDFYYLGGTSLTQSHIDYVLQMAVDSGVVNGQMGYDPQPSASSQDNYDTLLARGWQLGSEPVQVVAVNHTISMAQDLSLELHAPQIVIDSTGVTSLDDISARELHLVGDDPAYRTLDGTSTYVTSLINKAGSSPDYVDTQSTPPVLNSGVVSFVGDRLDADSSYRSPVISATNTFSGTLKFNSRVNTGAFFRHTTDSGNRFAIGFEYSALVVGVYDGTSYITKCFHAIELGVPHTLVWEYDSVNKTMEAWLDGLKATETDHDPPTTFSGSNYLVGDELDFYHLLVKDGLFTQDEFDYVTGHKGYEVETVDYMMAVNQGNNDNLTIYNSKTGKQIWDLFNDVVLIAKNAGEWSNIHAWYPMYGDTGATLVIEAKSATSMRAFYGSWVFDATGLQCNGANTYLDRGPTASDYGTVDLGLTIAVASNTSESGTLIDTGGRGTGDGRFFLGRNQNFFGRVGDTNAAIDVSQSTRAGINQITRSAGTLKGWKNGTVIQSVAASGTVLNNTPIYYGAYANQTSPALYSYQKLLSEAIHAGNDTTTDTVRQMIDTWEAGLGRKTWT